MSEGESKSGHEMKWKGVAGNGSVGVSRSAKASKVLKAAMQNGSFTIDSVKLK